MGMVKKIQYILHPKGLLIGDNIVSVPMGKVRHFLSACVIIGSNQLALQQKLLVQ